MSFFEAVIHRDKNFENVCFYVNYGAPRQLLGALTPGRNPTLGANFLVKESGQNKPYPGRGTEIFIEFIYNGTDYIQ
jgi:hypothetical protein